MATPNNNDARATTTQEQRSKPARHEAATRKWIRQYARLPPAITLNLVDDTESANRPLHTYTQHEKKPEPAGWQETLKRPEGVQSIVVGPRDCLIKDRLTDSEVSALFDGVQPLSIDEGLDVYLENEQEPILQLRSQVTTKLWGPDAGQLHEGIIKSFRTLAETYRPPPPPADDTRHKERDEKAKQESLAGKTVKSHDDDDVSLEDDSPEEGVFHFKFDPPLMSSVPKISSQMKGQNKEEHQAARKFVEDVAWADQTAAMFLEALQPEVAALYRSKVNEHLQSSPKSADIHATNRACFFMKAVLYNKSCGPHRDTQDFRDGFAVTMPFGDYEGAIIQLPELRHPDTGAPICFIQRPGDMLALKSKQIQHCVTPIKSGERWVLVYASKHTMIEKVTRDPIYRKCHFCEKVLDVSPMAHHLWEKVDPARRGGPDGIHDPSSVAWSGTFHRKDLLSWARNLLAGTFEPQPDSEALPRHRQWAERLIQRWQGELNKLGTELVDRRRIQLKAEARYEKSDAEKDAVWVKSSQKLLTSLEEKIARLRDDLQLGLDVEEDIAEVQGCVESTLELEEERVEVQEDTSSVAELEEDGSRPGVTGNPATTSRKRKRRATEI